MRGVHAMAEMQPLPPPTGLDADGCIAREGALTLIQPQFAPLVADVRARVPAVFGPRLHSAYLYGSVPRGTARAGHSDLDLLIALSGEPTDRDRAAARTMEAEVDSSYEVIDGVGILVFDAPTLLSDAERFDLGWFLACLCMPLYGDDLAARLPRYRPDSVLARETNGDLGTRLERWRRQNEQAAAESERRRLCRAYARHLVRTAFTLVMPRWGGWTSDLATSAEVFAHYYPARGAQVRRAAVLAREPVADPLVLNELADDLAPWLAAEYADVHGHKTPRQ